MNKNYKAKQALCAFKTFNCFVLKHFVSLY